MRILHVVPSYIPAWRYGGPIRSVHGLCAALAARGHEVSVATTNIDGAGESNVPVGVDVTLDRVRVRYFASPRLRRIFYAPALSRYLEESMPDCDLVHTHSVFLWPTAAAARIARKHETPYVISPRGMLVRELIDRRSPLAKRAWIALVERRNIDSAAAIHVTSELEAKEMRAMGLSPRRIFDIPNGFDLDDGGRAGTPSQLPDLPPRYVLYLGRISWKKGIDRLISALPLAPGAHIVVAGNDDENLWPRLDEQARDLGVASRVTRIGYVDGAAKRDLIARASLLVLPSHSENFGIAALEAIATGVPVVVTPEVGIASLVTATKSGLVASGDASTLAGAISRLLEDETLRRQLGDNGRQAARAYSWDAIAERMEREYEAILRENPARTRT